MQCLATLICLAWASSLVEGLTKSSTSSLVETLSFVNREQLVGVDHFVAWVEIAKGVTNIVGCSSKGGAPFHMTNFTDDDGTVVTGLRLIKSKSHPKGLLLWTQGPTDQANPTSSINPPVASTLVSLPVRGAGHETKGTPLLVGHELVTLSADGERALFATSASDTDMALCEVPTNPDTPYKSGVAECGSLPRSTLLLRFRGGSLGDGGAAWSPDGQTLSLAVKRSDHGFVAVWRVGDGRLTWLSPR